VRNWMICGPFGGPGAEKFSKSPRNKDEVHAFYEKAVFPPDDGKVDPKAVFEGANIQGYWNPLRQVRWKPATVENLDCRVLLGEGSQVWYGSTWIFTPDITELTLQLQGHQMTELRWFLNSQRLNVKKYDENGRKRTADIPVTLQKGWNQVFFRAYCVGYAPFRAGLIFKGPPEKLWALRLSGTPPPP